MNIRRLSMSMPAKVDRQGLDVNAVDDKTQKDISQVLWRREAGDVNS